MKKLIALLLLTGATLCLADTGFKPPAVTVSEVDGSPKRRGVQELVFPAGSVAVAGSSATITFSDGVSTTTIAGTTFTWTAPHTHTSSITVQQDFIKAASVEGEAGFIVDYSPGMGTNYIQGLKFQRFGVYEGIMGWDECNGGFYITSESPDTASCTSATSGLVFMPSTKYFNNIGGNSASAYLTVTSTASIGGDLNVVGYTTSTYFVGDGSLLTGLSSGVSTTTVAETTFTWTGGHTYNRFAVFAASASIGTATNSNQSQFHVFDPTYASLGLYNTNSTVAANRGLQLGLLNSDNGVYFVNHERGGPINIYTRDAGGAQKQVAAVDANGEWRFMANPHSLYISPSASLGSVYARYTGGVLFNSTTMDVCVATTVTGAGQWNGFGKLLDPTVTCSDTRILAAGYNKSNTFSAAQTFSSTITLNAVSGRQELTIEAPYLAPTVSSGCTSVTTYQTTTTFVNYDIIGLSSSTTQYFTFNGSLPSSWDGSTVTYQVVWISTAGGAVNSSTTFCLQGLSLADSELVDQAYGTAVCVSDTFQSTGSFHLTPMSAALTIGGTPAAGDSILWRGYRNVDAADDHMAQPAGIARIRLFYTKSRYND